MQQAIRCTLVRAGDAVVADEDGVAVVPQRNVAKTLIATRERLERERIQRGRLAAGELGLDIENMRARLADLGLTYFDTLQDLGEEQP